MENKLINPILRGFNPDASILKVEMDYYLATSTFEWMPGIEIYHSRDLVNWELISEPIQSEKQLNLIGDYNSGGIWAPHLSYSDGRFWLLITDVKTGTAFKDTLNYVLSTEDIHGDWGTPKFVTASGFDPAFFHDDDGKHYIMSMLFDHRLEKPNFSGLVIQEFNLKKLELVGKREHFYQGTDLGVCEGPQILKKDGWYYLLCAAGGTGYSHASTVCRSQDLLGPYEISPYQPLISTKHDPQNPLQKSGHASFIQVSENEWYISHICSRPLTERGNCTLGRETALQQIEWIDDWPRLANGTKYPDLEIPLPSIAKKSEQEVNFSTNTDFSAIEKIPNYFKTLRQEMGNQFSLTDRTGYLRLYGNQSITSLHRQTILARRWQAFEFRAETEMDFNPLNFQQMAGLVLFYDTDNWYYLQVSFDEEHQTRTIQVESNNINQFAYRSERIEISRQGTIKMAVEVKRDVAQFYYAVDNHIWVKIGDKLEADFLSDDYIKANGKLAFTGAMVGICAQDMDSHQSFADYKYFNYEEK